MILDEQGVQPRNSQWPATGGNSRYGWRWPRKAVNGEGARATDG